MRESGERRNVSEKRRRRRLDGKSKTGDDRKNKNGGWRQRGREGWSRLIVWQNIRKEAKGERSIRVEI